jgi:hypothetical protein
MSAPEAVHVTGHCYCGAVHFAVTIPAGERPIFTAYCHCDSCRRAHAAPLYQVACVDASMFAITAGAEQITDFHKPGGHITRSFCSQCGSKIRNTFGGWRPGGKVPVAFFPALLDEATQHALPAPLRAARHNRPDECVLEVERLRELAAFGG